MEEKVIIVTGGTGALGRFIVEKYAAEGWKVYIPVVSMKKFISIFDNSQNKDSEFTLRKIYAFECDALDESAIKEFVLKVSALEKGKINLLVNTVGGFHEEINVSEFMTESFDNWFNLNFKTAFLFSREFLNVVKNNYHASIVSISSIAAVNPMPGRLAYNVSKTALITLMETISKENNNVNCHAIVTSVIDTPANREWGSEEDIKKWVKPEEIADKIYNLNESDKDIIIKIGIN